MRWAGWTPRCRRTGDVRTVGWRPRVEDGGHALAQHRSGRAEVEGRDAHGVRTLVGVGRRRGRGGRGPRGRGAAGGQRRRRHRDERGQLVGPHTFPPLTGGTSGPPGTRTGRWGKGIAGGPGPGPVTGGPCHRPSLRGALSGAGSVRAAAVVGPQVSAGSPQGTQDRLELGQLGQQPGRAQLELLVRDEAPLVVDELGDERDEDRLDGRRHPQGRHHRLERGLGPRPGGHAAVADEADRLVVPLDVQVVEGVLEGGVVAVVVLGVHDGEGVAPGDRLRPGDRVGVGVVLGDGVVGLVEEREVHLRPGRPARPRSVSAASATCWNQRATDRPTRPGRVLATMICRVGLDTGAPRWRGRSIVDYTTIVAGRAGRPRRPAGRRDRPRAAR